GVVVSTPHYVTRAGPRTRVLPELVEAWDGLDFQDALTAALDVPVLLLNDAEVHGAGVIAGAGLELVVTLGTGLGNALFDGGRLAPHLELSRGLARWGLTYDEYIGEHGRPRLGEAMWSRPARQVVDSLRPACRWDPPYLAGGNSRRLTAQTRGGLGP